MTIPELYEIYKTYPSVQTDTRKLKTGDIFFALKGPNFNGNAFAQQALDAGAVYAVIDEAEYAIEGKTILVEDGLTALQQLAHHHRRQFNIPFIGITGSNGKTTTKELVHAVLSAAYKTYTTEGNLNNHIGVPLTMLKIRPDAQIAIIEMGANHIGEIASYCRIAEPTHGIITNCGKAHLEGFGSIEGVRKAKGELYDHLRSHDGTAFVMWDYDYLQQMSHDIPHIITYGTHDADLTGTAKKGGTFLHVVFPQTSTVIDTQLVGDYNLPNVLAATALGQTMNIDMPVIKQAIENYTPSNSRSQLIQKNGNTYILDAYNANPSSMKLAIENFAGIDAPNKILMLGAMAEMGQETAGEHKNIIEQINKNKWTDVVLVGKPFEAYANEHHYFENATLAADWFARQQFTNTYFLVKGSRSTKMETILQQNQII